MQVISLAGLDGTDGFRLDGINVLDQSGISVSGAGDVDGDGFADLIIGAFRAGSTGESYVVFGRASGFSAALDLAGLDGADGFRMVGISSNDESGRSVSGAGDVNGDGFADLIIGARFADPNGVDLSGESYVVFGQGSGFSASLDLADLDGADGFRLDGIDVQDQSGHSVSGAGDVNGDGFADVIVGAFGGAPNVVGQAGESYVVFGQGAGFTVSVDLADLDGTDGFRLDGIDANDRSGNSVSGAGDINGDGFDDLIIGAFFADPNGNEYAGESYVIFGRASGFTASLALAGLDGTDGFRLDGINENDLSGASISGAGDVNGDGFDDLIIGAYFAAPNGEAYAGESYVVFGKVAGFTAGFDLASLDGSDGFRLNGIIAYDQNGFSVGGAGDVNGDGFADFIIGARYADPNGDSGAGETYVVFGRASGFVANLDLADLDGADGFRLEGIDEADQSGRSVTGAGDVNGDGFDDLVVGAPGADPNGVNAAGESYVVFGFDTGAVTHQGTAAADILTGDANDNVLIGGLGADLLTGGGGGDVFRAGAGDDVLAVADADFLQADGGAGVDTLRLTGAGLTLDLTGQLAARIANVEAIDLVGAGAGVRLTGLSVRNLSDSSNTVRITGDATTTLTLTDAGWTRAFGGDAVLLRNGAGVLIVDPKVNIAASAGIGVGLLDLGTLDGQNGFRLNGVAANDRSGASVGDVGDFNGDGFDDVIVGAYNAAPDGANGAGESYLIFGKASGFAASIDLAGLDGADGVRLRGVDQFDNSGRAVSGAGDMNGDGLADLIIGAKYADADGKQDAGETYVLFGTASPLGASFNLNALDGADGFRLDGVNLTDYSGIAVDGAGDVNGDGFADLIVGATGIIGAPYFPNGGNESYVIFGAAASFPASIDLAGLDGADGLRLNGIAATDQSGRAVAAAGDVNGDGFADVIIGSPRADYGAVANRGESYVVFGKAAGFTAELDLVSLDGADGFRIIGEGAADNSGYSVSGAGDVNGDGFADVIVGATGATDGGGVKTGAGYVVFGKAGGFSATLNLAALDGADGFKLEGAVLNDFTGSAVSSAGDFNGDGFDDLLIGARLADPTNRGAAGQSFVVFGRASGFGAVLDLASIDGVNGFRIDGANVNAQSGGAVSGGGDVNGDGFDDLIVGARFAASAGGESYVIFGFATGLETDFGGAGDDVLIGDANANALVGGQGDDTLRGGGGRDALRGGAGDDVAEAASGAFRKFDGGAGFDTLRLTATNLALDFTGVGDGRLADVEAIDLAAAGSRVTLDALTILGLSETSNSVTVTGGAANRLILADEGWSLALNSGSTRTFAKGEARFVVAETLSIDVVGSAGADSLLGGSGDDILNGRGGNDSLDGGGGSGDLADYSDALLAVGVNLTSGSGTDGEGGVDSLIRIENILGTAQDDVLIGNSAANILRGGDGFDRIDGRAGADRMEGGAGDDLYTVTDVGDVVVELAGEGTRDRINAFVDFTNPENVEILVGKFAAVGLRLTGSSLRDQITGANKINSPDTILGLDGNDQLIGLVGDDILDGGAGIDRIFANSGNDRIIGGTGNDRMTGQQGVDTFVFAPGDGNDRITDFNTAQDLLDLTAFNFANFAAVQALTSQTGGGALIDLAGPNSIVLEGVAAAALGAEDVLI